MAAGQLAAIGEVSPFGQLQQQPTGFLQPQTTGGNPFRQNSISAGSTLNRQPTLSVQTSFSAQGPTSAPLAQPAAPFAQQFTSTPSPVQDANGSRATPKGDQPVAATENGLEEPSLRPVVFPLRLLLLSPRLRR
jgi:hypothetical protein